MLRFSLAICGGPYIPRSPFLKLGRRRGGSLQFPRYLEGEKTEDILTLNRRDVNPVSQSISREGLQGRTDPVN
jgi:hypothetical protein